MLGAAHTKAKMVVRSGSERFAAVRIFAFPLGMAGFIALTSLALPAVQEEKTAKA